VTEGPVQPREVSGSELLKLARGDRAAAIELLRALAPEEIAQLCQDVRPQVRSELLMLSDHPEQIVPLLPETELAVTIVAGGMSEAGWLLELATPEQRRACIDLDAWAGYELEMPRVMEWIDALIEAGRPTLVAALDEIDPEVLVLAMDRMADVMVIGKEEEAPPGWFTEDGVCYFHARSDEDFARVKEIAQTAFSEAQASYWLLVYGVLFESRAECEEYALKWRTARLADLGFPERDQAMRAWTPLGVDEAPIVELGAPDADDEGAVVPFHVLPERLRGSLVGRALAQLPAGRAADLLGYLLAVVNTVAVADDLPLADPDSIPKAIEKALRGLDRGLAELSRARRLEPHQVLESTRPLDLFRVGATLDPELRPEPPRLSEDDDDDDDEADDDRDA